MRKHQAMVFFPPFLLIQFQVKFSVGVKLGKTNSGLYFEHENIKLVSKEVWNNQFKFQL